MTDTDCNLNTVSRFWQSVNEKDIEGYLALFAEGAVAHDPVNKPPQTTQAARRSNMQGIFDIFTQLSARTDFVTACGDHTASKWTLRGSTHDGQTVQLEGIDVIRHAPDGQIVKMWGYFSV